MTSSSLQNPTHWWYVARSDLLERVVSAALPPGGLVLDVGSADGPSVTWLKDRCRWLPVDIDPRGLPPGGVCASGLALPFRSGALDAVSAFDVIEHFEDEEAILAELRRVVRPGGVLVASVPAYTWAWSSHDVAAGHHRRYTRARFVGALERAGFRVERSTYAFAASFPFFALDRLRERFLSRASAHRPVTALPRPLERFLGALARIDAWLLDRVDLPFGSSIFVVARRL